MRSLALLSVMCRFHGDSILWDVVITLLLYQKVDIYETYVTTFINHSRFDKCSALHKYMLSVHAFKYQWGALKCMYKFVQKVLKISFETYTTEHTLPSCEISNYFHKCWSHVQKWGNQQCHHMSQTPQQPVSMLKKRCFDRVACNVNFKLPHVY